MTEESVIWDLKDIKSKDPDVKWTAVNNLSKFLNNNPENFRSRMIIKSFLTMINDPHAGIRETIFSTLIQKLQPQQLEGLIKRGLEDSSPSIRSLSLEWLNSTNHSSVTSQAVSALQDPSEAVRKIALDIVVARNIKGVEQRLLELLKKEKGGLRRTVIYALGKIQTAEAIGTLIEIMRNPDFDDWTRNQASSALEHLGGKELVVPFIENLADENDYVRQTAAAFLKKNESDVTSVILMNAKLDYVALIQHATSVTKQDFSLTVKTLKTQMSERIHSLSLQLQEREKFSLTDLTEEWGASIIASRIILDDFLDLRLFPQPEDVYYTEKGLKSILKDKFAEKDSLVLKDVIQVPPFDRVDHEIIKELLSTIEDIKCVSSDLYILSQTFVEISENFGISGLLPLQKISTDLQQSLEVVSREFKENLVPNDNGWLNNKDEYLTLKFISQKSLEFLNQYHIIDLNQFLASLGSPKVEFSILRNIIERHSQGKWLDDIQVYITSEEIKEIEENSIRIDEERVSHLISAINMKFPKFLESLQKVLEIETYQSSEGQLISLESLYPLIQQEIDEKKYFVLNEFLKENSLESSVKSMILEYLNKNYQGRTDENANHFFTNDLLREVQKEFQNQTRVNYSVLGFKLNLPIIILQTIIQEILKIPGIHNNLGEFITLEGVKNEYTQIIAHKAEFPMATLLEILEVIDNQKAVRIIEDKIKSDPSIYLSVNGRQIWTHRRGIEIVNRFLKRPANLTRKRISFSEISQETEVSQPDIKTILNTLVDKNLVPGRVEKNKYVQ